MKCLKKNQCEGREFICPQKGSMPIKVSLFLLTILIMFSMATVVNAQSQINLLGIPQGPPNSQQEDRILNSYYASRGADPNWAIDLEHYMRDGCKEKLAGWWKWESWGDLVTITYDEKYKVFLGQVARPVKMGYKPGHLLFKVYFPQLQVIKFPENINIHWLREQKQCKRWWFEGTEYSFEQGTRKKTEMKLILALDGDQIQYKLEKKAWYLNRIQAPRSDYY